MRTIRIIQYFLFSLLLMGNNLANAKPLSSPYFLLGNGSKALVPVCDIAKWLNLNSSWHAREGMAELSNGQHHLELHDNSNIALIDDKKVKLDFPAVNFEGKLFVQPKIFHAFNNITISYQSPKNYYYSFETILRLINTENGTTLTFSLADLLYHMTADLINDGKGEDVFATRSFHTTVWIMRQQKTLWHESYYEGENIALIFGVYACNIISPSQKDLIIWSGAGGNYIGYTVLEMYHFNGTTFQDILPDKQEMLYMLYTTAIGGTLIKGSHPYQPPTFIQYNSIEFRHSHSRYEALWYTWNNRLGVYQRTKYKKTRRLYHVDYTRGRAAALRELRITGIPFQKYFLSCPHFTPFLKDIYPIVNTHDT